MQPFIGHNVQPTVQVVQVNYFEESRAPAGSNASGGSVLNAGMNVRRYFGAVRTQPVDHLLERAIRLAAKVHKGQVDRFGKPYVMHVMRVMMRGHDAEEQVLGALHDVLERSELKSADILARGFPERVVKALEHISRREGETYEAYIDRVLQDGLAARVKLHDLADKMDLKLVEQLDPTDLRRYNKQLAAYHRLKRVVEEARANMTISKRAREGA